MWLCGVRCMGAYKFFTHSYTIRCTQCDSFCLISGRPQFLRPCDSIICTLCDGKLFPCGRLQFLHHSMLHCFNSFYVYHVCTFYVYWLVFRMGSSIIYNFEEKLFHFGIVRLIINTLRHHSYILWWGHRRASLYLTLVYIKHFFILNLAQELRNFGETTDGAAGSLPSTHLVPSFCFRGFSGVTRPCVPRPTSCATVPVAKTLSVRGGGFATRSTYTPPGAS